MVFVKGKRADQVRAIGSVWRQGGSFLESTGAEGGLYGRLHLGAGPFTLRARMRINRLAGSDAALAIDAAKFGFGGGEEGEELWCAGELLAPEGKRMPIAGSAGHIEDGREFLFELQRSKDALVFRIDGAEVYSSAVEPARLGSFGFLPGTAKMRIDLLEATGDLCPPLETYAERVQAMQPAINQAIDRGIDYLLESQRRDGSWYFRNEQYPTGATSLALYALVKSGLEVDHPAVLRGLAYLKLADCSETYASACQLMALGATRPEGYRERMQTLLDQLLDWQTNGSWNYPWGKRRPIQHPVRGARIARCAPGRARGSNARVARLDPSDPQLPAASTACRPTRRVGPQRQDTAQRRGLWIPRQCGGLDRIDDHRRRCRPGAVP